MMAEYRQTDRRRCGWGRFSI